MPSSLHEQLTRMLRDPEVLIPLLRQQLGDLPTRGWSVSSEALGHSEAISVFSDGVLLGHQVVLIPEIQLHRDPSKLRVWPLYGVSAAFRWGRDAIVVVVTLRRSVARWAQRPIQLNPLGSSYRVLVIGPDQLANVDGSLEMLTLSALACGGRRRVCRAMEQLVQMDNTTAMSYMDIILQHRSRLARSILEMLMNQVPQEVSPARELMREFLLRRFEREAREKGHKEGHEEGRQEGRQEGRVQGREEGREEGSTTSLRATARQLLDVLGRSASHTELDDLDASQLQARVSALIAELARRGA